MKSYLFKPKEKSRAIKMRFVFFALLSLMLISASSSAYAQEYTITFSLDDGTLPEGVQNPIHYTVENRPTELPTPGKIGYEFGGWYTTSSMESGTEFNSIPADLAEDITLYAKWNIISYNITYKLKDADDYDGDGNPDYPADNSANQPTYDINGYTFADPTRLAFTFIGWWNNTNSIQYTEIPSGTTGNFTVNAGWKKNWYVLMFDKGYTDAEGSIEDVQFDVSKPSITLPEVSYTHAGYEHTNKWVARDANGDPVYYNGGATLSTVDEYKELISLPSSLTPSSFRITFVPDWAPKIFKVTFKDGETTFSGPTEVAYLADIPLPATDPTKTGYTFDGWDNLPLNRKMPAGDLTLNAQWTPIRYTITFNTDGGTAIDPIIADYGSAVTAPAAPTKTGYTFAGWNPELPATMPLNGQTVEAKWDINQYTITFNTDGGTAIAPITADYGSAVTAPTTNPTKTGYTFAGWDSEIPATMPLNGLTVNAKWTPIKYAITYELNDGGEASNPNPDEYTIEGISLQGLHMRPGYTFAGWYDNDKFEGDPVTGIAKGTTGDKHFYAKWTPIQYNLVFENGGISGCTGVMDPMSINIEDVVKLTKNTYAADGYYWAGWIWDDYEPVLFCDEATISSTDLKAMMFWCSDYTITLKSDWHKYYTITYVLNGGALATGVENPTKYTDLDAVTFNIPSKDGYDFAGWHYHDEFKDDPVTGIDKGSAVDITLYAKWTPKIFEVTFKDGETTLSGPTEVAYLADIPLPTDPTKTGYTFAGWDNLPSDGKMPAGDLTLNAQWTPNQYTITFNTDGGSTIEPITADYGSAVTKPADPAKTGYTFAGWDPELPATMPLNGLTVEAKWDINQYAVSLPAGLEFVGTDIPADHKFDFGSTVSFKVSDGYEICATSNNPSADVAGVTISENSGTYSFTVPASDVAISADFMADVTLTVSIDGGGWTYGETPKTPSVTKNGSSLTDLTDITFTYKNSKGEIVSLISRATPAGNYTVAAAYAGSATENPATAEPANFTIGKSALYVTAEAKSKSYGEDDPALTYQVKDHNGNPVSADLITIALKRAEGENPGTYAITVDENVTADLSDKNNYTYGGFTGANFTIGKGKIIVAAKDQEVEFAGVDVKPEADLTPAISGLRPGDNADDVLNQGTLSWGNEWFDYQVYNNHPYTIECSGFSIKEPYKDFYEVTCKAGVLTIIPAPLDIVVDNLSKYVGAADPAFTYHIQGLKGSDKYNPDQAVRKGDLVRESGEDAGEYEIHESSSRKFSILSTQQGAKNYTINIVPGKFTIRDNYMVEFHSDYGTPPAPIYVAGGNTVTAPTDGNMTDDHYTFDGNWYTDETFATQFLFGSDEVSGDVHLYAKWTPNELYTVTLPEGFEFVDNPSAGQECGFGFGSVVKFKVSDSYKLDGNVTSDVANLYIAKDAKGIYYFEMPVSDVKVNGKAKIKVTITVTLDDFEYGHPIQPVIYKDGVEISDPDPSLYLISYIEKRSYNYVRDISKASVGEYYVSVQYYGTETESSEASDDVQFKITQADITITVDAKTKFSDEDDPELTYKAEGLAEFDKNKDLSELFTGKLVRSNAGVNDPGTYDITQGDLAPKSSNYTIKAFNSGVLTIYTPQIVTFHTVRGTAPAPMKVANGKPFSAPTDGNMTSAGYTFSGDWYTDESFDRKWDFDTDVTDKDLDLYAKWGDPIEYNITFDTDGGSDIDPITYTIESETIDLSTIKAEKPYYDFVKWVDNNGTEVKQISKGSYGDIALKANYAPSQYSITFDVDGGSNIDPIAYTIESETIDLSAIKTEKVGYHFVKWLDDKDAEVTQIVKGSNGNVALTALFEAHSFTKYIYNNDATTETDGTETAVCDHEGCNAIDVRIAEGTKLPCSISDEPTESVVIYAHHNTIVVENAVEDIFIYDIDGRCVANRDAASHVSITMQREGIYIVKCGNTVKRVLVM